MIISTIISGQYAYLSGSIATIDGVDDVLYFNNLKKSLVVMGIAPPEQLQIFAIIAGNQDDSSSNSHNNTIKHSLTLTCIIGHSFCIPPLIPSLPIIILYYW